MVSTFTPNIQLEQPARGDQVGTWNTAVNNATTIIDRTGGGIQTITVSSLAAVLLSSQYNNKTLIFSSTLTASITVTFPTSFIKPYEVMNLCSGTSAFTITLKTTASGGQVIGCPPQDSFNCLNDGINFRYQSFGKTGTFWDYAGSSLPNWVSACTVAPYLLCDGTTFNSSVYPALFTIMGTSVLPDARGRGRFNANQGTGRNTTGITGDVRFSAGGSEFLTAHTHTNSITDPGHSHGMTVLAQSNNPRSAPSLFDRANAGGDFLGQSFQAAGVVGAAVSGVSINNAAFGTGASQNMSPAYIGGITMIRSA